MTQSMRVERPQADNLDDYLDELIPIVQKIGEDLWEEENYVKKSWLEFRDDEKFHETVLHYFDEGNDYLKSVDSEVSSGSWRYLEGNKFLLEIDDDTNLYDLAFLDQDFFILKKHGEQKKHGKAKYFLMVHEPLGKGKEWLDLVNLLYDKSLRSNQYYFTLAIIVILIIVLFLLLSQG